MHEVIYQPQEKKLYLAFEFVDQDLKKFMDTYRKDKSLKLAPFQIKVKKEENYIKKKNYNWFFQLIFTFNLF